MSGKKQLTKQRITYGSLGDSNSREKEEFADKQSIGKRVSFEAPSLSSDDDDDDSNVENTFGRSNLTSGKRDSFGGLFGGSSFGDRQISDGFAKSSADDIIAKDSEHPRPAPRRHPPIISPKQSHTGSHSAVTSQLSAHNPDVEGTLVTWPVKAKGKQPVPVPRTSPQNNHSDSSSLDTNSPRPIPRSRPKLSPREGTINFFEADANAENDKTTERPRANLRKKHDLTDRQEEKTEQNGRNSLSADYMYDLEHAYGRTSEIPKAPLRKKHDSTDEQDKEALQNKRNSLLTDYMYDLEHFHGRTRERPKADLTKKPDSTDGLEEETRQNGRNALAADYMYDSEHAYGRASEIPKANLKKKHDSTEEQNEEALQNRKNESSKSMATSFVDQDGKFIGGKGNLVQRHGNSRPKSLGKAKGGLVSQVSREEFSDESGDEIVIDADCDTRRQRARKEELRRSEPQTGDRSPSRLPKPSPRSHISTNRTEMTLDQEPSEYMYSGTYHRSTFVMTKTGMDAFQSKQTSLDKESTLTEHVVQRMPLKKSLTPQRPQSAKKSSLLNKLKTTDLRDTFEEHAPQAENIIDSTVGDKPRSRGTRPLKANQELNEMTKSPQLKETVQKRNWTERKPPSRGSSPVPRRASSMTNLRGRSPDSSWRQGSNAKALDRLDSSSIRQAVYDEWLTKKHSRLKEQVASKVSEKKKQEEKEEEERQRKQLAKRAFDSWNEKKQEANRELSAKKKELMKKEFEKQREKNLKARDAKKYFESWKGKKDDELKEKHQKKREEMNEKKKKEQEEKQETKSNAKRAFENWKGRKDEVIKEEIKKKKKEEMENAMKEEDEKYERSIQCAERYQAWVEKKGKPRRGPPPPTLTQRGWCPSGRKSGNCIPETVQSVIQVPTPNRSRTLSGTMLRSRKF